MFNYPVINIFGNAGKGSGYRQAVTNIMECFLESKIKCNFGAIRNHTNPKNFRSNNFVADIDFILSAPPYRGFSSRYKISYFYWETDRFPSSWKRDLLKMDEIWCPCDLMADAVKKIGFNGVIRKVPTPMRRVKRTAIPINFKISNDMVINDSCFKFYSIFQWQYRKGYDVLIKSYLEEFSSNENVILILKVNKLFQDNFKRDILNYINKVKSMIGRVKTPKILIVDYFISNKDMDALHDLSDCFVLPHRGEGWGMPIARAMMHDNHIITTRYGGVTEYLDNSTAGIIEHRSIPVMNMEWCNLYEKDHKWAEPSAKSLKSNMRNLFDNEDLWFKKILNRTNLKEELSFQNFINVIESEFSSSRFQ